MLLVTESLTLIAGTFSSPRCVHLVEAMHARGRLFATGRGCSPSSSGNLSWTMAVRSPPSSRIMFSGWPSGKNSVCSMHQSNSSFGHRPSRRRPGCRSRRSRRRRGPACEKMLQLLQVTSAPSSVSVSISTAVWIVMCRQPAMRAPGERLRLAVLLAEGHQAGHFVLGQLDLFAAPFGQAVELSGRTIENLVRQLRGNLGHGTLLILMRHFRSFHCKSRPATMASQTNGDATVAAGFPPEFVIGQRAVMSIQTPVRRLLRIAA